MRIPWVVLVSAALIPLSAWAEEEEAAPEEPKPEKVTKLNGVSLFGIVEVTDDYTIRVKSDTGISKVPIAQLGDKDFQKYGFQKDRSKDGKFWSERQGALEEEKESNESNSKEKKQSDSVIEIKLTEIAPFQPLIDAYEKSIADKKEDKGEASKADKPDKPEESQGRSLFSKTGIPGLGNQPFTGMGGTPLAPAASAAGTAVQSVGGGLPGGVPGGVPGGIPGGLPAAP